MDEPRKGQWIDRTKNARIRSVTLSPDALAAVHAQRRRRGLVFLNENGAIVKPHPLYTHLPRFRRSILATCGRPS